MHLSIYVIIRFAIVPFHLPTLVMIIFLKKSKLSRSIFILAGVNFSKKYTHCNYLS